MMNDPSWHATQKSLESALFQATAMNQYMASVALPLSSVAQACADALKSGNTIFFCGNGGSAAESQHLATEFVVRLSSKRNRSALASVALTTDTSLLTACSNDFGFDRVFARQVEALMKSGDVLILLSTSGKSPNLLEAARVAREKRGVVVSFLGESQTPLDELSDHTLHIPSPHSQRVQEGHLMCGHMLVEIVESVLYDQPSAETGQPE